ncbi:hypothetical protein GIB67_020764, partial [Kingdonia uniflora]
TIMLNTDGSLWGNIGGHGGSFRDSDGYAFLAYSGAVGEANKGPDLLASLSDVIEEIVWTPSTFPVELCNIFDKDARGTKYLRCGEPAADCVYSNFSFVLNEEPLEEPDVINMGVIFGEEKSKSYNTSSQEGDDDTDVDFDDWLYFPSEQKQIDISKNIRDIVHLEITINTVCNSECRGLCLNCGVNLNTSSCNCSEQDVVKENSYGSWGNLKSQIQQK